MPENVVHQGPNATHPPSRSGGFTLLELMVVIAMLALLAAILLPSMSQAFEVAYSTMCQGNLHGLSEAMQGNCADNPMAVPDPNVWMGHAVQYGSQEMLLCIKDEEEQAPSMDVLADYYILQNNGIGSSQWWICNIGAVLGIGNGLIQDPQLCYKNIPAKPTAHSTTNRPCFCWVPEREENQHLISITDEASVLVTIEKTCITFKSYVGCNCKICYSDHWLMKGPSTNGNTALETDQMIMQLGGYSCRVEDPNSPFAIYTEKTSYGMNGLIQQTKFGPQQLMLMDANAVEINPGEDGWLDRIKPRHRVGRSERVNYATVDGAVRAATLAELHDEYLLLEDEGPRSRSLWNYRGCPGPRN